LRHRISSNNDMVVWQRTLVILVKKGDGRHALINKGFGTAGTPPQIPAVRAIRSSTGVNSGGWVRARTCRWSCYTVSGLGTHDSSGTRGASQLVRPDYGMNWRRDPLPLIEQHNGVRLAMRQWLL
jgi:hypothetical protein